MARSRVELFEGIRRDHRREELSIRGLADRYGVHRRTVREALGSAAPPPLKTPVRVAPRLDPAKALIDAMLRADLDAPRKQRHTARRVHARLCEEHDQTEITYSTVRDYVRVRRPEIWAEAGRTLEEVFVPQTHEPGAHGEVDFADLWIILGGVKTKVFLFTFRLSFSGKSVHRAFATQLQEAFLEGHVAAFDVLGGLPVVHVRYDNLKAAVSRVLFGRNRVESERWAVFRSHYGFESFYCTPGRDGAHEKGGVEGEGGRFRRTHLVPMPVVESLAELNTRLVEFDRRDDARRITGRPQTVGHDFAVEARVLLALPGEEFETGLTLSPRVDRHARITVRQCRYSVPAKLIGRRVRVLLRAVELLVFDGSRHIATHPRATNRGVEILNLDHYLEVLARKPGALPGATALSQARAAGTFDHTANPNVDPATIATLATGTWVGSGAPVCLIGDSGTGKSHLLIGLGVAAAEARHRVRYVLASRLVNELAEADNDRTLSKVIARYGRVDLLCLDELGYLALDRRGAELLFQVLTEREERSAVAVATNEPFSGWTKTFTDPRLCAAIVDRLTFAGHIIETGTTSYRLAHTRQTNP